MVEMEFCQHCFKTTKHVVRTLNITDFQLITHICCKCGAKNNIQKIKILNQEASHEQDR